MGRFVAPRTIIRSSPDVNPSHDLRHPCSENAQFQKQTEGNGSVRHEFGLHHAHHLVIIRSPLSQKRIYLIHKDD